MKLLIVVVNNPDLVGDIVPAMVNLDVRGIVSMESESVMQFLAQEVPIFAGLRDLVTSPKSYNKTIFGISEDPNILDNLYETLAEIGVDLQSPGTGYALTIPVEGIMEGPEE